MKENNNIEKVEISNLIRPIIFKIISKKENWESKDVYRKSMYPCQYCKKRIENVIYPDYFHLWNIKDDSFITFHFICAFDEFVGKDIIKIMMGKRNKRLEPLDKIIKKFNYKYDFETNICY